MHNFLPYYRQEGVDSIRKLLSIWLIAVILLALASPSLAADKRSASEQMLAALWTSQTVERLNKGTWAIPEIIVAQYLADLPETEKSRLKNPALRFLPNNRLQLSFDHDMGRISLTGEIAAFAHNRTESFAEFKITKKEIAGQPIASYLLKFIPLGAVADVFGNPVKNAKDVETRISGNRVNINFRPLLEKTFLQSELGKRTEITGITTQEGLLLLHTNWKAPDLLSFFLGREESS